MKILVTGSTGFIGSAVTLDLKSRGENVYGLVRKSSNKKFLEDAGITCLIGDITDKKSLISAFKGMDAVIHTAGCVTDWARKADYVDTNCHGTLNVLEACLAAGVRRVLYFSTVDVLGHDTGAPINEKLPLRTNPGGYAYSKTLAEKLVRDYMAKGLLDVTIVYPSWVYGQGDKHFVPEILDAMDKKCMMFFRKRGDHNIELNYIGNLTEAVAFLIRNNESIGKGYILSDMPKVTFKDFVGRIAKASGHKEVKFTLPYPAAYATAAVMEFFYSLFGIYNKRPLLTKQAVTLLGNDINYDVSVLNTSGYVQRYDYEEAMNTAMDYYLKK